jgi:hypothetical protein
LTNRLYATVMAQAQPLFELRSLGEIERDRVIRRAEEAAARGDLSGVGRYIEQARRHAPMPAGKVRALLHACFAAQNEQERQRGSRRFPR